jgi:formamidopyrimidine-DNA glycosylase
MPELPEVEIVARNLTQILKPPFQIQEWNFFRKNLRFPIPQKKLKQLIGQSITGVRRRAKYLLFEFENDFLIAHLGMTGAWRVESRNWSKHKHDHLAFRFNENQFLVYEDPRRFGFVEVCAKKDFSKRFQDVGAEPLDPDFNEEAVTGTFRKLAAPIKNALMNQKLVVGIGNIYASEILFKAKVSPLKKSSKVSKESYQKIWKYTRETLQEAIDKGGSTIENYRNSFGESGEFQNSHQVYGREGEKCLVCGGKIKAKNLAGRNTFWCGTCQS